MGAKGFAGFLLCVKNKETHGAVYYASKYVHVLKKRALRTPCTSIAKTVQKIRRMK
jgi:hypothetical protein